MATGPRSNRPATIRVRGQALLSITRWGEWWEYKLVPILTLFYATAVFRDVSLLPLLGGMILLLGALVPGAVFVAVINDLTDLESDLAAGKPNRLRGRSLGFVAALALAPAAAGLALAWLWRNDLGLLVAYAAAWLCFLLYSVPPVRLKARGWAGAAADAGGSLLFPSLVAAFLAFRWTGTPIDAGWTLTAAIWALAYGLRGILWHQLKDAEADAAAGVRTVATRHRPERLVMLGRWVLSLSSWRRWRCSSGRPGTRLRCSDFSSTPSWSTGGWPSSG